MFNILAMVNRTEFEEVKSVIYSKKGYAFDTMKYSNNIIEYRNPFIDMTIRTTSENRPIDTLFHGYRGDIVFVNKEIVSEQLIRSVFIPCCMQGRQGIYDSHRFVNRVSRNVVIDVLVVAETTHFEQIKQKLKQKSCNTRNTLTINRANTLFIFNTSFVRITVVRPRILDLCAGMADVVFIDKEKLENRYLKGKIYEFCNTGKYGIKNIYYLLNMLND